MIDVKSIIKDVSVEHTNSLFLLEGQIWGNFIKSHKIVFNLEYFLIELFLSLSCDKFEQIHLDATF
jgi:hypothetical protein